MSENKCPKCGAESFPDLTLTCHSYTYTDGRFCQSLKCKLRCAEQRIEELEEAYTDIHGDKMRLLERIAELEIDLKTERSHRIELQLVADHRKATIDEHETRIAELDESYKTVVECNGRQADTIRKNQRQIERLNDDLRESNEIQAYALARCIKLESQRGCLTSHRHLTLYRRKGWLRDAWREFNASIDPDPATHDIITVEVVGHV